MENLNMSQNAEQAATDSVPPEGQSGVKRQVSADAFRALTMRLNGGAASKPVSAPLPELPEISVEPAEPAAIEFVTPTPSELAAPAVSELEVPEENELAPIEVSQPEAIEVIELAPPAASEPAANEPDVLITSEIAEPTAIEPVELLVSEPASPLESIVVEEGPFVELLPYDQGLPEVENIDAEPAVAETPLETVPVIPTGGTKIILNASIKSAFLPESSLEAETPEADLPELVEAIQADGILEAELEEPGQDQPVLAKEPEDPLLAAMNLVNGHKEIGEPSKASQFAEVVIPELEIALTETAETALSETPGFEKFEPSPGVETTPALELSDVVEESNKEYPVEDFSESTDESVNEIISADPIVEMDEDTAEEIVEDVFAEGIENAIEETTEGVIAESIVGSVEEPIEEVIIEGVESAIEETADNVVVESVEASFEEPAEEVIAETAEDVIEENIEGAIAEPVVEVQPAAVVPSEQEATDETPDQVDFTEITGETLVEAEPAPAQNSANNRPPVVVDVSKPDLKVEPDAQSGETAKALLDMMSSVSGGSQPQERALAADTLLQLVPRMMVKDLVALSERVCLMESPPPLLVSALINYPEPRVAGPLLQDGMAVSEQELLSLIANTDKEQLIMVAKRRSLSSSISDALISCGDPSVYLTLVRNPGASFSHDSFVALCQIAKTQFSLQAPLATRGDTPPPIAFELFWSLPVELRRYILSRFLTDSATLDKILKLTQSVDGGSSDDQKFPPKREVSKLVDLIAEGVTDKAAEMMAKLVGCNQENASRIIMDPDGEPLTVVFKAMGVTRAFFAEIIKRCASSPKSMLSSDRNLSELQVMFELLSFNKARTLLTYWDWAIEKTGPYTRHAM